MQPIAYNFTQVQSIRPFWELSEKIKKKEEESEESKALDLFGNFQRRLRRKKRNRPLLDLSASPQVKSPEFWSLESHQHSLGKISLTGRVGLAC